MALTFNVTANPRNSKGELKPGWKGEPVQRKASFSIELGNGTLPSLVQAAKSEQAVHDKAVAAYIVDAQAYYRGHLEAEVMNPAQWIPGMTAPRAAKTVDFSKMSAEDISKIDLTTASEDSLKALTAKLQAALKAKKS